MASQSDLALTAFFGAFMGLVGLALYQTYSMVNSSRAEAQAEPVEDLPPTEGGKRKKRPTK
jgi:hypothetical protein